MSNLTEGAAGDGTGSGRYAIVGYGFRLPGGIYTAADFWQLLSGRGFIREPVAARYGPGYEPVLDDNGPSRFAASYEGLMRGDEPYRFDGRLFGISTREASAMDPQLRMLLTCTWEALEQAGWDHAGLRDSRTGVFTGAWVPAAGNGRQALGPDEFAITGTSPDMLPNRISYAYSLMGPSAACASAVTALHAAVTALEHGDCDQAIVGASSFLGSALASAGLARLGVLSPDGACRSFDATANGYMRAEGAFVYLLKPLAAAERDGDRILAVVAGTAVNAAGAADGATGPGPGRSITAPTQHAQASLMRAACARAGLSPDDVDYLEAHATGTRAADRIEGNAIREVFGGEDRAVPLRLASVKSNVGHMEAAAFACALLKVLLMFEHRTYAPASGHFAVPSPDIDFTGLRVQTDCEPFGAGPVTVGINSLGLGGANGHCLLTEYRQARGPAYSRPAAPDAGYLIPLSARTPQALTQTAAWLRDLLATEPDLDLYTLAGNLSRRRTHFAARAAFAVASLPQLAERLDAFSKDPAPAGPAPERTEPPRILMVFAGQGTQWAGCGRALYDTEPVFRRAVDAVDAAWRELAGFSLRDACFTASQAELDEVRLAQPVVFLIEVALTELLKTWGVYPDGVIGHSAGEVAAAYAAGIHSLAEATRLTFHRAVIQQRTAGSGRLLAVSLDRPGTAELLAELGDPDLEIACENAPASTVICGPGPAVAAAAGLLGQRRVPHRLIRGNIAFHSRALDVIEADLRASLAFLDGRPFHADIPFVSSVTGELTENLDAAYWWGNVRRPVRFMAALGVAAREVRPDVVLEISPHMALTPAVRHCLAGQDRPLACVRTLGRDEDPRLSFHQALGALYRAGVPLDFAARYPRPRPASHLLPPHPKDERPPAGDAHVPRRGDYSAGPLLGRRLPGPVPRFEVRMSAADFPWLAEHRVRHAPVMPAAGYVEMILEALGGPPAHFEVLEFARPCLLSGEPVRLRTELEPGPGPGETFRFLISSSPLLGSGESVPHCTGQVSMMPNGAAGSPLSALDRARFADVGLSRRDAFYQQLDAVIGEYGQYGPHFQTVHGLREDPRTGELLLELELDDALWHDGRRAGYLLPPPLLDGGLQAFLYYLGQGQHVAAVPRRMEGLTVGRLPGSARLVCHVVPSADDVPHDRGQLTPLAGQRDRGSLTLYDAATGERVAHLAGYASFLARPRPDWPGPAGYVVRWQPKFVPEGPPPASADVRAVIDALSRRSPTGAEGLKVAEFTHSVRPDDTAAAGYLRDAPDGAQPGGSAPAGPGPEFWLVGASAEDTKRLSEAFGAVDRGGPAVRFATADLSEPGSVDLAGGLLCAAACALVVLDAAAVPVTAGTWDLVRRLLVPGGLALVRHPDAGFTRPGRDWSLTTEDGSLWAAPPVLADDGPAPGPRWVIAGRGSLGELWVGPRGARRVAPQALPPDWLASAEARTEMGALRAVDFFCDEPAEDDPLGEELLTRFLAFARELSAARESQPQNQPEVPCRLTVITRRAAFDVASPRAAGLWGAVRALGHQLGSRLDLRLVDVGEPADLRMLGWLARHDVRERELAISGGRLHAPRLMRQPGAQATFPASAGHPYQLCVTSPGQLAGLELRSRPDTPPGGTEVEVDVAAAALNPRDARVALDLLPLAAYQRSALGRQVGIEASGTVRRAGAQVTDLRPGDQVVFMRGGCIANRVTVDERAVFPVPGALTPEQAAASLSAYVTAYHALVDLARLRPGQRVLVHSAPGGVGQAAIALARRAGATVYATAGSEAGRRRLAALGVAAAFDSNRFRWYDDLLEATGDGVDVVLNSLAGPNLALCLRALRPGGWHCELGQADIYADTALGLSVFGKNLRFAAIDIDRLMHDDPAHFQALATACLRLLADGAVPPPPVTAFSFADYAPALRSMARGQHEDKLVLTSPSDPGLAVADRRPFLDPTATYLVTGALGRFGRHLLAYLVSAGARHLTLLGTPPGAGLDTGLDTGRDQDRRDADWVRDASGITRFFAGERVEIDIVAGDVARRPDVDRCLAGLTRPLRGVFHLAAVLGDRPPAEVTPESLASVFAPPASGAWHLHQATSGHPLDHFVLLSPGAAVTGHQGPGVHAVASAYLGGLARYRRHRGQPALAYDLAALPDTGVAAGTSVAIAGLDYALRALPGESHLVSADVSRLAGVLTAEDITREICHQVATLSGEAVAGSRETIASFGLSSLSAAELISFVRTWFGHDLSARELMTTATPESIATAIVRGRSGAGVQAAETPPAEAETRSAPALSRPAPARRPSPFASTWADHFGNAPPAAPGPPASSGPVSGGPAPARPRSLAGVLPGPCQEDLELLVGSIRELTGGRPGGPPVPADQFGAVFLTGATGFVGRFVLSELLRRSDHMLVHCLVRAPNAKQALARVQDALESAGLWDDFLGDRIRAWPGDLREPRFGLPELDFRRLCDQVDAVYHLAAERDLLSPYAALRETSTRGARTALELALRRRAKHLVYASAMEVFPSYFCDFGGDFAGQVIGDEEQPDLDLMRSVFPPGAAGYPWSKLVVEQALLSARSAGLPVAIMRLPKMDTAAGTGFTRSGDIKVRIAMAALDAGVMPSGFRLRWTEPVDTVSELLTAISLNPRRRHAVYHLCNPAPQTWGLELADFGFDLREVSYAEFKRTCQARGPGSPLHGHWPLVDRFARYWFSAGPQARPAGLVSAGPVSARAVENDAPDRPAWPGLVTMTTRSSSWISRQASWPYRRPSASVAADALHRRAERIARHLDVRFGDAYPPELLEGLGRLAGALRAPEARIRADRLAAISFELGRKLANRAALAREYASEPAIAREPVEQPVFIVGVNRAGTTFLHRLLAQGPRFWAPYRHELAHPALPAAALSSGTLLGETGRRQYAADVLAASGVAEAMEGFHPGEPEEDFALLEDSFAAWSYTLRYHVPGYASWLAGQDGAFAYGVHRRTMQHLSWQRGTRLGATPRQWLLTMPFHLAELETLVATYPDAIFIQIHREPREDMPSWLALTETVRAIAAQPGDPSATGAEQLEFMSSMLGQAARFRAAYPEIDRRFADVSYLDLAEDPAGTVAEIYRHFGWVFDDETKARTERWQARQVARHLAAPGPGGPGRRQGLARYGLTAPQVDAAFARYAEFVRENKVRLA